MIDTIKKYGLKCFILLCTTMMPLWAMADGVSDDVSQDESDKMAYNKRLAPTWQETDETPTDPDLHPYLDHRRALAGSNCQVNRYMTIVGVGTWTEGLGNLTNEDLDDEASIPVVLGADVAVSPLFSVRDMDNYYDAGTTAGFCLTANSGTQVVSLDLIKSMHIWFYCDGKKVDDQAVREGSDASGVKLSLISVGNNQACVNLTAKSTKKFDEVMLVRGAGVNVQVGGALKVRYAFVGDSHDIYLTTDGVSDYCVATGHSPMNVSCDAFMPSTLVGGIPVPMADFSEAKVIDSDLTNSIALVSALQLASAVFKGRVRVNVESNDDAAGELFHAGEQVGFKYTIVEVLDLLSLGAWIEIKLYDHKGKEVQTSTVSADVLALSLASGGDQTSYITAETDFSGAEITFYTVVGVLDLGSGFGVYYGFVRPKATVDNHHCDINPSYSLAICEEQSTYQLLSNDDVSVTWSLVSAPDGSAVTVTPDGYVQNLDKPGNYVFRAYSTIDGCYEDVTITHGIPTEFVGGCETLFVNSNNNYVLSDDIYDSSGSLLSISNFDHPENILDNDRDSYAEYNGGLNLADNLMVLGVKTSDSSLIFDGSSASNVTTGNVKRVGFMVETTSTGLTLNALNFFNIRCYNDGVETYRHALTSASVVGVTVAGNSKGQRVRFMIDVPAVDNQGNPVKFDEFQLWKSGVLTLAIDDLKVYYAFAEDIDANGNNSCGNVVMDGATVLNYNRDHASVSVEGTGVANVGSVVTNLSNIVDYDPQLETYATVVQPVNAGNLKIHIKMGHVMDFRQQVGIVIDNTDYVNISVAGVTQIYTCLNGVATGETQSTWEAVGVNVIRDGDQTVLLMQPTLNYDEIVVSITGGLEVAKTMKIYGVIFRNDIDHDGVTDIYDDDNCANNINEIKATDVCVGGNLRFTAKGQSEVTYSIKLPDQPDANNNNSTTYSANSDMNGNITASIPTSTAGIFYAYIYDGSNKLLATTTYTVHPLQTTWKISPDDTNWNNWNNWTNGSPYLCTDVIIPSNASKYPSLDGDVVNGDEFGCDRIFFESRAAVEKVFKLNYTKAWVNLSLEPNRYYLLSAPLQNMYTGDMFVSDNATLEAETGYPFVDITSTNYPQNRFAPRVFQRLYEKAADVRTIGSSAVTPNAAAIITETRWSRRFNALNYKYNLGESFSLWTEPEENTAQRFMYRFPKTHTEYDYYNEVTRELLTGMQETGLTRTDANTDANRFSYEAGQTFTYYTYLSDNDRKTYEGLGLTPLSVTANAATSTKTFLVGNPFMSHIDVATFLTGNSETINSVKTYDGNTASSAICVNGEVISTAQGFTTFMPMEGFFVEALTERNSVSVRFTEAMFSLNSNNVRPLALAPHNGKQLAKANNHAIPTLRMSATTNGITANALLLDAEKEVATEVLFDNEAKPQVALFTLENERAYDINTIGNKELIPLGIWVRSESEITLNFIPQNGFDAESYELVDGVLGEVYSLDSPINLTLDGTSMGRYFLRKQGSATGIQKMMNHSDGLVVSIAGEWANITSMDADIESVEILSFDGKSLNRQTYRPTNKAAIKLPTDIGMLRINLKNKPAVVRKYIK